MDCFPQNFFSAKDFIFENFFSKNFFGGYLIHGGFIEKQKC